MAKIYGSAAELVGRTPLVRISRFSAYCGLSTPLLVKLEYMNPAGSAKDRIAKEMVLDAEAKGLLKKGGTIIEPTSGNTGIGLASIGAARGYRVIITMPETMSRERRLLMSAYGAELVLTKGELGMNGAIAKAEELSKEIPGSFIPDQFGNPTNPLAHFKTTGPEIWEDTDGQVDIFTVGIGTGGSVTGVGRYLKMKKPGVQIVGVEPADSPLITQGHAGSHGIQGIGANFIPKILDICILDEMLTVATEDAYSAARTLAVSEGILVGISSGAALWAAAELGKRPENAAKTIVALLTDSGERYLSTKLFDY